MAFQSAPDCVEAVFAYTINLSPAVQVWTFKYSTYPTLTPLTNLAVALCLAWETNVLPLQGNHVDFAGVTVKGLTLQNDISVYSPPSTSSGGIVGSPLPANVAFCVSFRSGLTGRSARGRTYFGGLVQGQLATDENYLGVVAASSFVDAAEQVAAAAPAGWAHVVVSRFANGTARPTAVTFPVNSYIATDRRVDSQRGRLP